MIEALVIALLIPLLLMILLIHDEKMEMLLAFFAWGSIAGLLSFYVERWISGAADIEFDDLAVEFGPLIEEYFKALPLFFFLLRGSPHLKEKDMIQRAIFAGIGFSIVENYYYIMESGLSSGALAVFILTRSLSTTIMHGLTTGFIGFSIFYIRKGSFDKFGFIPIFVIMAFAFSVMFHALFNLYVLYSLFGKLMAIISGLLLYLFVWTVFELYYDKL